MSLTDPIRDWFQRTPRAQEVVRRLSADLDVVAAKVESAMRGLLEKVGPIIDPPAKDVTPPAESPAAESPPAESPPASASETHTPVGEQQPPPPPAP
jgi:hypothetical protein